MRAKGSGKESRLLHKAVHVYAPRTRKEAIAVVKQLNAQGIAGILSYLPARKDDAPSIRGELNEYQLLVDAIHREQLDCEVSLKLHQFGVYGNRALTEKTLASIVRYAHKRNILVWFDMELSETVDATLSIFKKLRKKHKNVGICLQAYLRRTKKDMQALLKQRSVVMRLVKGFYKEYDFKTWAEVTANYSRLMEYLLLHSNRPGIATHDRKLIAKAKQLIKKRRIKTAEFQFFKGVCDDLALRLRKKGFNVRIYVPYGRLLPYVKTGFKTFDTYRQLQRIVGIKNIR